MKPLAKWYLGSVLTLGLAVVLQVPFAFDSSFPPRFVLFFILASIGSCLKLRLPAVEGSLSVSFFFILLAVPQLSLGETIAIATFAALVEHLWGEKTVPRPTEVLFNISVVALAALLTWDVYHSVMWGPFLGHPVRMSVSACIYFMAVTWPLSALTAVNTGERIVVTWRNTCRWTFPYYLLGAALAGASNWSTHTTTGQAVAVGLTALVLLYRAYSRYLSLLESERNRAQADRQRAEETSRLHLRTIQALALAIEAKDAGTASHLNRLRVYTEAMGRELGMSSLELDALKAATLLHDVGKLAVPEHILSKPGSLTPEEFEKMKIHTVVGAEIVESVAFPYPVAPIVRGHHEHWDGSGYPDRLRGEEIPMGARVLAAVDTLDSLLSPREYRPARSMREALTYIHAQSGRRFDPRVVEVLAARSQEMEARVTEIAGSTNPEHKSTSPEEYIGRIGAARHEAQVLFEINQAVGNTLRLDTAFAAFATGIAKLIPFHTAALYLKQEKTLRAECTVGEEASVFSTLEIPIGQGLSGWVAQSGTHIINGNPSVEPAYTGDEARFSNLRSALVVPIKNEKSTIGVLALYHPPKDAFTKDHLRVVLAASATLGATIENVRRYREAEDNAGIDFLTELPNARSLSLHLERELTRCTAADESLVVMVGDLDGFKQVNDRFGHLAGNQLLQQVAAALKAQCRGSDFVARMGGDEFALVLPGLPLLAAIDTTERFVRAVEAAARPVANGLPISLSLGVARLGMDGHTAEALLESADLRMYDAKSKRKQAQRSETLYSVPPSKIAVNE